MALVKCHECNKEVSTEAKNCPSCGATVKKEKPPRKIGKILKWTFLSMCVLTFVGAMIGAENEKQAQAETPEQKAERTKNSTLQVLARRCAEIIEASLKYPEDAEIPNIISDNDKFFYEEKNGIYLVQVKFKARTESNALRKSTAECKWKLVKDNYEPIGGLTIVD